MSCGSAASLCEPSFRFLDPVLLDRSARTIEYENRVSPAFLRVVAGMRSGWTVLANWSLGPPDGPERRCRRYALIHARIGVALIEIVPGSVVPDAAERLREKLDRLGFLLRYRVFPPILHFCMPLSTLPELPALLDEQFAEQMPTWEGGKGWVAMVEQALGGEKLSDSPEGPSILEEEVAEARPHPRSVLGIVCGAMTVLGIALVPFPIQALKEFATLLSQTGERWLPAAGIPTATSRDRDPELQPASSPSPLEWKQKPSIGIATEPALPYSHVDLASEPSPVFSSATAATAFSHAAAARASEQHLDSSDSPTVQTSTHASDGSAAPRLPEAPPLSPTAPGPEADNQGAPSTPDRAPRTSDPPVRAGAASAPPDNELKAALLVRLQNDTASALCRSGERMIARGDILSARLLFERAAALGSGRAATAAGKTYDPDFLASLHADSQLADRAAAVTWYRKAGELGDSEAVHLVGGGTQDPAR
jgi:hypothetical protein